MLTAIIRSYRKKLILRGFLQWWFATKAIESEEIRSKLEITHSKTVENLENNYSNRFKKTKERQIGHCNSMYKYTDSLEIVSRNE